MSTAPTAPPRSQLYRSGYASALYWVLWPLGVVIVSLMLVFLVLLAPPSHVQNAAFRHNVGLALFSVLAAFFLLWGARCLRQVGVRMTDEGVTIRYVLNRTRRVAWSDFERFGLQDGFPYIGFVATTSGRAITTRDSIAAVTKALGPHIHEKSMERARSLIAQMNADADLWRDRGRP